MSDLGIVVPQVRKAEVGYYSFWQWQQEYEQAHPAPPIENIRFEHDPNEGDIVTIRVETPAGLVAIMAKVAFAPGFVQLKGTHIEGGGPRTIGPANLRVLVKFLMKRFEVHEAIIEGAARTTGANPGHRPRFRFTC